jgi:hypothetical protein
MAQADRTKQPMAAQAAMTGKTIKSHEASELHEEVAEAPFPDSVAAAIEKIVARGKERGYVTYNSLNAALASDQVSSEHRGGVMVAIPAAIRRADEHNPCVCPPRSASEDDERPDLV